ncbi:LysR family transcriptional regulator [Aliiroseovarius sp. S1339]|uniref:LysR family transcriptional regulator n=1 Tax=Aliiroseovarius sp. S1339 TaxID=2936990 RepID=UPI0020BDE8E9|nr:LysR family transcriptional regulator [Aliiroseovarius sp. S1339]MCK8465358.1 LysR family transcriptional regulator [Aliiroseovarius sp. S1339]
MHNENWDDLRYVLTVAETGSVLQAAKHLGVNHATVLRHVAAFEERHGAAVFERTARGYQLMPDRVHVIRAAQDAEVAIREVSRLASGGRQGFSGTIRITSTDTLCAAVLSQFAKDISAGDRNLSVTLLSSNAHLDLIREQAHIVVRPSVALSDDLVGTAVAELGFAAYAKHENETEWFVMTGALSRSIAAKWMGDNVSPDHFSTACDSFLTLREMAALGGGIAVLPCFIGDREKRLIRLHKAMPHMSVPLWMARHVDTIETQQLRAVRKRLGEFLADQSATLLGATAD